MANPEPAEELLCLLSVAIGSIMEDEVDAAVSILPDSAEDRCRHFGTLRRAGEDIAGLAVAAEILLRRAAADRREIPLD